MRSSGLKHFLRATAFQSLLRNALLAALLPCFSQAATKSLSVEQAIQEALARNYDLKIDREELPIAEAAQSSATAAYIPSLTLGTEYTQANTATGLSTSLIDERLRSTTMTAGITGLTSTGGTYTVSANLVDSLSRETYNSGASSYFGSSYGTLGAIEFKQPLLKGLRTDSTRLTIKQSKLDLKTASLTIKARIIDTITSVEQAYNLLIAARESVKVREAALSLAKRTLDEALTKMQVGTLAPLDEKQAQSSVASTEADLISAQNTLRERENALKLLITDDFDSLRETELVPTGTLEASATALDYQASISKALANRADLGQLDIAVQQKELSTRYQKDQKLPQLDLITGYGVKGASTSSSNTLSQWGSRDYPYYTVGVTLTIPLSNRKEKSNLRQAELRERQARLRLEQARDAIRGEVDTAVHTAKTAFERISATRRAREYAEAALEAEQNKLGVGKSTQFTVLQLQKNLTSARSDEWAALADYANALSSLRQKEASSLEFRNVTLAR